jgi:hypothetical protein
MLPIKDTEIKDGRCKPGKLLENGQRMVESDSLGEVLVRTGFGARRHRVR